MGKSAEGDRDRRRGEGVLFQEKLRKLNEQDEK
jgi:hypothetical protein